MRQYTKIPPHDLKDIAHRCKEIEIVDAVHESEITTIESPQTRGMSRCKEEFLAFEIRCRNRQARGFRQELKKKKGDMSILNSKLEKQKEKVETSLLETDVNLTCPIHH